jgi:glyoxylase I family protein
MNITQSLHTAILVADLEKAEYFYSTVLGLPKVDRTLKFPGVWYQLGDYQLHLIVDTAYSAQIQNSAKWGRNPHIAFAVDDLDAAQAQLMEHGYEVQRSASGRAALFTHDPDGNIIELSEITPA